MKKQARDSVISAARKKSGFSCSDQGTSERSVRDAEERLGLALPREYRDWLTEYGYWSWFGVCIRGISPTDRACDVVHGTVRVREMKLPKEFRRIPDNSVVIRDYGGGGYYFLLCGEDRTGSVVLLTADELYEEVEYWKSFWDFLQWSIE